MRKNSNQKEGAWTKAGVLATVAGACIAYLTYYHQVVEELAFKPDQSIQQDTTRGTIGIGYQGGLPCQISVKIEIGDQIFIPKQNPTYISNVKLGWQPYVINGQVSCPFLWTYTAHGQGRIYIEPNKLYLLNWSDIGSGYCYININ